MGRRPVPDVDLTRRDDPDVQRFVADLFEEAGDVVEVVRRLWDSWEDDADIKDVATGRFVDRDKLHYVDFAGRFFSVKGPSIVPRPPQGQPLVAALAHSRPVRAGRPGGRRGVRDPGRPGRRGPLGGRRPPGRGRRGPRRRTAAGASADLVVFLDDSANGGPGPARARLDQLDGRRVRLRRRHVHRTAGELVELLWIGPAQGLDGFRLRPAVLGHDLTPVVDGVVPRAAGRRRLPTAYDDGTLRERLGLARPVSRYATASAR